MTTVSMTEQELNALVQILNRAPVCTAETIFLQERITRWAGEIKAQAQQPPAPQPDPDYTI